METKTSIYTKAQRHEIYKMAKELLIEQNSDIIGMCCCLTDAAAIFHDHFVSCFRILESFPEFAAIKPDVLSVFQTWFDGMDTRLKNFDLIIEQTKS